MALDGDFLHLAVLDLRKELGEGDPFAGTAVRRLLEKVEQRNQQQTDNHPKREISTEITQAQLPESCRHGLLPAFRAGWSSSKWTD